MASDKKEKSQVILTKEELERIEELRKSGAVDLQACLIDYAKRFNGYPYISASRIEREPAKGEKASFLFEQMQINYLIKNTKSKDAAKDFMDVFGNGKIIFIQAHQSCPTLGADGLYSAMDPNGKYIKTIVVGHFVINEPDPEVTNDQYVEKDMSYYYKDKNNDMFVEIDVVVGAELINFYDKYGVLYKRPTRPWFEPIIVVAQPNKQWGRITGDPFHTVTPAELAATLKANGNVAPKA